MTHDAHPSPESLLEHREWLRAIARSLVRDESAVDDVEQRTWLTVLRNRRPVTSARGWLRRVVRSAAIDEHRSDSRRQAREEGSARPESLPPTDHLVMQMEAQRAVAAAVSGLPEPYRTTVLLRYIEELSVKDVAARMAVPVKTVETRLRRALALLREALDRDFGDRRAWCLVLLPLTKTKVPIPIGAATAGATIMAAKTKAVVAAVAIVLLASGIVWTTTAGTDAPSAPPKAPEVAVVPEKAGRTREHAAGPKFAIAGRVRSRHDGRLVAGARVSVEGAVRGAAKIAVESADDGRFRIEGATAGSLHVVAPRLRASIVEVAPPAAAGGVVDLGDVWLDGSASLVVEVLGPGDAKVGGAEVTVVRRRHHGETMTTNSYLREVADPDFGRTALGSAKSGADGVARFDAIAPGVHELVVRAPGFASAGSSWVEVPPDRDETRTTVRLSRAFSLSGRVVTATGEPAAGRLVDAGATEWDARSFVRTGADGRFALDDVPAGDVSLRVGRARGTNPVIATVRVPDVSEIELRLPAMGAVSGIVTTTDGRPVSDAEVGVETDCGWNQHADAIARTDADGRWRIDEIPAGTLGRFDVRHAGLYHVGPRLEVGKLDDRRGGKELGIDARVLAGGELRLDATMAKGARLHGRVAGPDGGVAGAWVYLHLKPTKAGQEWETAVADGDGRYEFDFLPPGPAAAVPLHPSYVHPDTPKELGTALGAGTLPASLTFDLPEGGDVVRDFTMVAGTRIAGRVTGASGEPVAGATVRADAARYGSPPTPVAVTDAAGAFAIDRVAGLGASKVRVQAQGLVQVNVPDVTLAPNGRVDGIEVRMTTAPRVSGRVLDAEGSPVADARVTLSMTKYDGGPSPRVFAETDSTGTWSVAAPRVEGAFAVTATSDAGGQGRAEVVVSPGGATVDVRFAAAAIVEGRVSAADGGPVAGAVVIPRDATKGMPWYYGDLLTDTSQPEVVRARTDESGGFRLALPTGRWALIVRCGGFVDEVVETTVPSADAVAVSMPPAATMSGRIRGDDGKPLAGAVVILEPGADVPNPHLSVPAYDPTRLTGADRLLRRHTDAAGAFTFPGIPEGSYSLVVVLPAATSQGFREVRFGPLRPSGGPAELSLSAPISNALSGRIVDAGGEPYSDARVLITVLAERAEGADGPNSRQRWTQVEGSPDGTFRLDDLTSASYTLQVTVFSGMRKSTLPDGTPTNVSSRMQKRAFHGLRPPRADLVLEMAELPRVHGRLVDDAGAPLAGWMVTTTPLTDPTALSSSGNTRPDGTFEIRDVEDADFALQVQSTGWPARRVVLDRPVRGGALLGDVVATLEARIRGRVVEKAGAAVAGAQVQLYPVRGGLMQTVQTGTDGSFEATGLDPAALYFVGVVGANGTTARSGDSVRADGVRPGTNDVRLVRE